MPRFYSKPKPKRSVLLPRWLSTRLSPLHAVLLVVCLLACSLSLLCHMQFSREGSDYRSSLRSSITVDEPVPRGGKADSSMEKSAGKTKTRRPTGRPTRVPTRTPSRTPTKKSEAAEKPKPPLENEESAEEEPFDPESWIPGTQKREKPVVVAVDSLGDPRPSADDILAASPLLKFDYNFPPDYYPNSSRNDPAPCIPRENDEKLIKEDPTVARSLFMVDWREEPYDKDVRDTVEKMQLDDLIHEVIPRNPESTEPHVVIVSCTHDDNPERKYILREHINWSYAKIHGYTATICFSKEMQLSLAEMGDAFDEAGHSWKTICLIAGMRKYKGKADFVMWMDDDAFIRPSHFNLPLSHFLQKIKDNYHFAWDARKDFNSGAFFVRVSDEGMEILLNWVLENHLFLWLHQGRQMSDQMALTSVMVDALDKFAGNPVTHRQRLLIGTVMGRPWTHFWSWKEYVPTLLEEVFEAKFEGKSERRSEKTAPYWFISSHPPFHPTYQGPIPDAFIVHPSGRSGTLRGEHKPWETEDARCTDDVEECEVWLDRFNVTAGRKLGDWFDDDVT